MPRKSQSLETRLLRSKNMKLRHMDPEYTKKVTAKLIAANTKKTGKTLAEYCGDEKSNAIREKMSEVHRGKKQSTETKDKKNAKLRGKTRTQETCAKISAGRLSGFANGTITLSPRAGCGKGGYREDLGHYVRSSYEHKFAQALKALDIAYKYENIKYLISVDGVYKSYTPDFEFSGLTVDIKNSFNATDPTYLKKIKAVKDAYNISVITIIGDRWRTLDEVKSSILALNTYHLL